MILFCCILCHASITSTTKRVIKIHLSAYNRTCWDFLGHPVQSGSVRLPYGFVENQYFWTYLFAEIQKSLNYVR